MQHTMKTAKQTAQKRSGKRTFFPQTIHSFMEYKSSFLTCLANGSADSSRVWANHLGHLVTVGGASKDDSIHPLSRKGQRRVFFGVCAPALNLTSYQLRGFQTFFDRSPHTEVSKLLWPQHLRGMKILFSHRTDHCTEGKKSVSETEMNHFNNKCKG